MEFVRKEKVPKTIISHRGEIVKLNSFKYLSVYIDKGKEIYKEISKKEYEEL